MVFFIFVFVFWNYLIAWTNIFITKSVKFNSLSRHKGRVRHYRIESRNTGNDVCLYVVGLRKLPKTFVSMTELFDHYSANPLEDEGQDGPTLAIPIAPSQNTS